MSYRHNPVHAKNEMLRPWFLVVLAMENAGWDIDHSTSYHQRLARACAQALKDLEKKAGVR